MWRRPFFQALQGGTPAPQPSTLPRVLISVSSPSNPLSATLRNSVPDPPVTLWPHTQPPCSPNTPFSPTCLENCSSFKSPLQQPLLSDFLSLSAGLPMQVSIRLRYSQGQDSGSHWPGILAMGTEPQYILTESMSTSLLNEKAITGADLTCVCLFWWHWECSLDWLGLLV